ncbi:MAG TPA: hypothetical protein VE757_00170 [Gaiellaceae bacterium]|nr:hypothetical protein [Gaiellaceae bacterium]
MEGWQASQRWLADGSFESEQRIALRTPVVEFTRAGGESLGRAYWFSVQRATRSLVRPRCSSAGVELRLLGRGPALLRFGPTRIDAGPGRVECTYPIDGGLLTTRAAGEIEFVQTADVLGATVRGFFPRLLLLYRLQRRAHVAVSRRYFARLLGEAGR